MDDEDEPLDEEWLEEEPDLRRNDIAVCCDTCGAINLLKYHTPRSKFSYDCPKCRRRMTMRGVQSRYAARKIVKDAKQSRVVNRALLGRLDALERYNNMKIEAANEKLRGGVALTPRLAKIYNRRLLIAKFYVLVRGCMERDIRRGDYKPFAEYINDEELNERVFGRAVGDEFTAVESDVV